MRNFFENLVARLVEKGFNATVYDIELIEGDKYLMYFVAKAVQGCKFHTYKGYLGTVGDLKVTVIDGEYLGDKNYISLT